MFPGTLPFTPLNAGLEVFVRRQRRAFKSQQEHGRGDIEENTVDPVKRYFRFVLEARLLEGEGDDFTAVSAVPVVQ